MRFRDRREVWRRARNAIAAPTPRHARTRRAAPASGGDVCGRDDLGAARFFFRAGAGMRYRIGRAGLDVLDDGEGGTSYAVSEDRPRSVARSRTSSTPRGVGVDDDDLPSTEGRGSTRRRSSPGRSKSARAASRRCARVPLSLFIELPSAPSQARGGGDCVVARAHRRLVGQRGGLPDALAVVLFRWRRSARFFFGVLEAELGNLRLGGARTSSRSSPIRAGAPPRTTGPARSVGRMVKRFKTVKASRRGAQSERTRRRRPLSRRPLAATTDVARLVLKRLTRRAEPRFIPAPPRPRRARGRAPASSTSARRRTTRRRRAG